MHQTESLQLRRSARLAALTDAQPDQNQGIFYPFLAFGQFANQYWAMWPAQRLDSSTCLENVEDNSDAFRHLLIDKGGYHAVKTSNDGYQWFPVRTGPLNTCRGNGIRFRIQEGRQKVQLSEDNTDILYPHVAAVTDRTFSRKRIWYLVLYGFVAASLDAKTDFTHRFGNQISPVLKTDRKVVLQLAPSWITIDDFEIEEHKLLNRFYTRLGHEGVDIDVQRCTKLAALLLRPDNGSIRATSSTMPHSGHTESTEDITCVE